MDEQKLIYRVSSFCAVGTCIEVAKSGSGGVLIRDSGSPGHVLEVSASDWAALVAGVKAGEFDDL